MSQRCRFKVGTRLLLWCRKTTSEIHGNSIPCRLGNGIAFHKMCIHSSEFSPNTTLANIFSHYCLRFNLLKIRIPQTYNAAEIIKGNDEKMLEEKLENFQRIQQFKSTLFFYLCESRLNSQGFRFSILRTRL